MLIITQAATTVECSVKDRFMRDDATIHTGNVESEYIEPQKKSATWAPRRLDNQSQSWQSSLSKSHFRWMSIVEKEQRCDNSSQILYTAW